MSLWTTQYANNTVLGLLLKVMVFGIRESVYKKTAPCEGTAGRRECKCRIKDDSYARGEVREVGTSMLLGLYR
jgi:hypothetical protein